MTSLDTPTLIGAAAAGLLVLSLFSIAILYLANRRRQQSEALKQRLAATAPQTTKRAKTLRLWYEGQEATTVVVDERMRRSPWQHFLQLRTEAGFKTPPELLATLIVVGAVLGAGALFVITGSMFPACVGLLMVPIIWWWFATVRIHRNQQKFERQLVDGLELCARALKAGHPLLAAFQLIADEIPAPVGQIFAEICQQQALGVRMEDALRRSALQTKNEDMQLFSAAMAIHLRSGGNLAEVMQGLAFVIRERMRLGRRFRTLIAQTQISKRILIAMPIIMFIVLNIIGPAYMQQMYNAPKGQAMLAGAALGLLMGWFVMNKMANLKV
ncbi:MAG TPA: type II secretion system F family protein [Planctomycetota bacterium]|nr:type II secretion system F family protein [Planctomycetota bacterium]